MGNPEHTAFETTAQKILALSFNMAKHLVTSEVRKDDLPVP